MDSRLYCLLFLLNNVESTLLISAGTTVTDLPLNSTLPTPTPPSTEHGDGKLILTVTNRCLLANREL